MLSTKRPQQVVGSQIVTCSFYGFSFSICHLSFVII